MLIPWPHRRLARSLGVVLLVSACGLALPTSAQTLSVQGLYNGGAIIVVDGQQYSLKEGESTPEGVLLVSANSQEAVVEIEGERRTVELSRAISTSFSKPEKVQVRINAGLGGHHMTPGRINGRPVEFLVDTGATTVAINKPTADRLGLNYRAGTVTRVSTANGVAAGYRMMLKRVRVGDVEIKNVEAIVSMGDFPSHVLLGNSFLNRVDMRRKNGVLILEAQTER